MVSISFFVLLLATYCYSIPIDPRFESSKPDYELTTGKTIVDHDDKITMHLMADEESTDEPDHHHKERSFVVDEKDNTTTSESSEHHHDHMSRSLDNDLFSTSTIKPNLESPSSAETDVHDSLNKFFFTTMESIKHFEKKETELDKRESDEETTMESIKHFEKKETEPGKRESDEETVPDKRDEETVPDKRDEETVPDKRDEETVPDKRESDEETTMESIKHFEKKETVPVKDGSDEEKKRYYPEQDSETVTDDHTTFMNKHIDESHEHTSGESHEHTSSVDSFGKMTGLLKDKRSKGKLEIPEESTTPSSDKTIEIIKTEVIFPVKVTETKITGEKPRVVEKEKSNY